MARSPNDDPKPNESDIARIDALEGVVDDYMNTHHEAGEPMTFALNGSEPFLHGDSLSKPQLVEIRRRYSEWKVDQCHDRDGWHLRFEADPTDAPHSGIRAGERALRERYAMGVATDLIITYSHLVVLIERGHEPLGLALPGGMLEPDLDAEENAIKEAYEETGLDVTLTNLFGVYSKPDRDPRSRTVSLVYEARGTGILRPGDDAKQTRVYPIDRLEAALPELVFDHARIVSDYLDELQRRKSRWF